MEPSKTGAKDGIIYIGPNYIVDSFDLIQFLVKQIHPKLIVRCRARLIKGFSSYSSVLIDILISVL